MKPFIKEIIKLSPDYPEELIVLEVKGSLSNKYLPEFFKKISLISSKFMYVVIDMSHIMMISPNVIDKFISLTCEFEIRGKKILFVKLPYEIYAHQIKTTSQKTELYLFKSIDEALEYLDIKKK